MRKGSSLPIMVAVDLENGFFAPGNSEICLKIETFLFFPMLRGIFRISFQNNCYSATGFIKKKDNRSFLEIIENISGSSSGSSPVAVGSSRVAIGIGQNGTATKLSFFKSNSYKKVAVVAVDFIEALKTRFFPFFRPFITMEYTQVAVDFGYEIFINRKVISSRKSNCYLTCKALLLSLSGFLSISQAAALPTLHCIKNRLYLVIKKIIDLIFRIRRIKVLSCSCGGCRLEDCFQVGWSEPKKAKLITAHKYKKCGRWIIEGNKINSLWFVCSRNSAVRLGLSGRTGLRIEAAGPTPPQKAWRPRPPAPPTTISKIDQFLKGFLSFVCRQWRCLVFRKVGGAGGVLA